MGDMKFHCPECGGHLVVDERGVGLTVRCSHCLQSITIPNLNAQGKETKQKEPKKIKLL